MTTTEPRGRDYAAAAAGMATAITAATPTGRRIMAFAATAGLMAAGLAVAGGGTAQAATFHKDTTSASYFISSINAQRVKHGRPKLVVSSTMNAAAARWAASMAHSNDLAHNPHLATSVSNWRYLGENVGVGYTASSLEDAFYASPEHRANMLDTDFTQIGVAVVVVNGKMWVAEEYRRPMHAITKHKAKAKAKASHTKKSASKSKPVLHVGSRGNRVRIVQRLLHITADGIFGPQTRAAVESFQRHHHLTVNGKVGAKTLAALRD